MLIAKPCTSMKGIIVTPQEKYDADLEELCECLADKGYRIKRVTKFLALITKNYDITVFPSGKIIVKDTSDREEALEIAREIYGCFESCQVM